MLIDGSLQLRNALPAEAADPIPAALRWQLGVFHDDEALIPRSKMMLMVSDAKKNGDLIMVGIELLCYVYIYICIDQYIYIYIDIYILI